MAFPCLLMLILNMFKSLSSLISLKNKVIMPSYVTVTGTDVTKAGTIGGHLQDVAWT